MSINSANLDKESLDPGERATNWVCDHLLDWRPVRSGQFYLDASAVVAEVAVLWLLRLRAGAEGPPNKCLREFVEAAVAEPAFHERLGRFPRDLPMYLPPFVVLRETGAFEPYRSYVQAILDSAWSRTAEVPPYRLLELRYFADHLKLRHRLPTTKALAARTVLTDPPSPALIADAECYALAHTVLYLTDLGRGSAQSVARSLSNVRSLLETLIGVNLIDGNYDLASELLLAARCLHLQHSYEIDAAWSELKREQQPDGSVKSRREAVAENGIETPSRRALFHATIVFAMACAVGSGR